MESENCLYRLFKIYEVNVGFRPIEKICMFAVTLPSLLKSTDPKTFFARIKLHLSNCKNSFYKMFLSDLKNQLPRAL